MASPFLSQAQESCVRDAFSGIWPVTDPAQTISLNGRWSLKVTEGTDNSDNVPPEDDGWKTIPVPDAGKSTASANRRTARQKR